MAVVCWALVFLSYSVISTRSQNCGRLLSTNKIINGMEANLGEFPWMALLLYGDDDEIVTACGGSLISERYVLTAAHCIAGRTAFTLGNLTKVRLGEHDLTTDEDCVTVQDETRCAPKYKDVPVQSLIVHPEYSGRIRGHNDIALIKLAKDVTDGQYVIPVCLPDDNVSRKLGLPRTDFMVAGWGVTEDGGTSSVLLKTKVPLAKNYTCGDTHICAGGGKTDSCSGDSGGPLMFLSKAADKKLHWYVAGITSFGPVRCGTIGKPGTYTKTSSYLNWISSVLAT